MERHTVTTDDNYILTMHRIPYSPKTGNSANRPVAFLMHGMLSSSSDWVLMGPERSLAYMLADAGYDVWMGNARGNTYSKAHKYWPTFWQIFWNFSWNEIGIYDVPAMIDYVLAQTDQTQVQYVGHSQGTTVYLVMVSEKPAYNDKIKSAHLLGPAAYMGNMKSPLTRAFAPILGQPNAIVELAGSMEFMPSSQFKQDLGIAQCQADSPFADMCANEIFLIGGYDTEQLDYVSFFFFHNLFKGLYQFVFCRIFWNTSRPLPRLELRSTRICTSARNITPRSSVNSTTLPCVIPTNTAATSHRITS